MTFAITSARFVHTPLTNMPMSFAVSAAPATSTLKSPLDRCARSMTVPARRVAGRRCPTRASSLLRAGPPWAWQARYDSGWFFARERLGSDQVTENVESMDSEDTAACSAIVHATISRWTGSGTVSTNCRK